jgi:hypothetical protein
MHGHQITQTHGAAVVVATVVVVDVVDAVVSADVVETSMPCVVVVGAFGSNVVDVVG